MDTHTIAVVAITVLTLVILAMDWVPTPLNKNIRQMSVSDRLPGTLAHSLMCLAFGVANLFGARWAIAAGGVWFSMVFAVAVLNWWLPYFFGVAKGEITPENFRSRYAANTSILPPIRGRVIIPDLQHILIHTAIVLASLSSWWSFTNAT